MIRVAVTALVLFSLLPTAAAASHVKLLGGYFDPSEITIAPGGQIVWTNEDSMPHTVTSTWDAGASFDEVLRQGETFSWTFPAAGDLIVHCRPHAYPNEQGGMDGMVMTVHIGEPAPNVAAIEKAVPAGGIVLALTGALVAFLLVRRR